ncbi:MAG: type II toxin-antitoxin system YafQ family toxin [Firmicutes bacterium]|nr:type II toxin-antitoxin system YafQ family toxin [Bacillota bacterium]
MRNPVTTNRFVRDVALCKKRGFDSGKLRFVMDELIHERPLPFAQHDHILTGNYMNRRECHIAPDWLLIYKLQGDDIIFERTGSHADLFR